MNHISRLDVYFAEMKVGTLAQGRGREVIFQYDQDWVKLGFDLSPTTMDFSTKPQIARDSRLFEGLHGAFADSLPDAWGRTMMNRVMRARAGWTESDITPLDRLAYIGNRAMGALEYRPILPLGGIQAPMSWEDLTRIGREAQRIVSGRTKDVIEVLRVHGGSPGGARPKLLVAMHKNLSLCQSSFEPLPPGFSHWLVKFRGPTDPSDMGAIEYAYNLMAKEAGLEVPDVGLTSMTGNSEEESIFLVKRFDRDGDTKLHVLTLAGYAYADHRTPSLDYEQVLGATMEITRDHREVEKAFRLMVFNVLAHNQDDHAKNFSFVRRGNYWHLAPAYDLTFSVVQAFTAQHWTSIAGQGLPRRKDVMKVARNHGIQNPEHIIEQVRAAIANLHRFTDKINVTAESKSRISDALTKVDSHFQKS